MILSQMWSDEERVGSAYIPCNIVADQAKTRDLGVGFHYPTKGTLGVLCHGVRFVEDDDFVRWTRVGFAIGGDGLGAGCLTGKVLNLFSDDGDATFIRGVQFKHSIS